MPTVTKAHFQFSVYQILQCLRGRKSKNKVFLDERERMRIHKIPPKLGRANAQLLDCCFLPSLSRGPNFPDWFRFYFWGQRTGEQKRGILPTQVHVKIIWYYRNTKNGMKQTVPTEDTAMNRAKRRLSYCLSQILHSYERHRKAKIWETSGETPSFTRSPGPFLTPTGLECSHPQRWREKRSPRGPTAPVPHLLRGCVSWHGLRGLQRTHKPAVGS